MKALHLTLKLRNNRLRRMREELGLSAPKLAEAAGVPYGQYIELEGLKLSPTLESGQWRKVALAVANFHGVSPDELFPEVVQRIAKPVVSVEVSGDALAEAADPHRLIERKDMPEKARAVLSTLTDRERKVLEMRFGISSGDAATLDEVGSALGVGGERVRMIEGKALRKLRHPKVTKHLKEWE